MHIRSTVLPRPSALLFALCFIASVFLFYGLPRSASTLPPELAAALQHSTKPTALRCRSLPGAADTLVVMKMGSTDFNANQIPTHFDTTLLCVPNYILFSDHDEIFRGQQVHDVLHTVSEEIRNEHQDFELYRQLQQAGKAALTGELSGKKVTFKTVDNDSTGGKRVLPGWKLDKWKFLPMLNQTLALNPLYKWYFFIEPDSFFFWSTILKYQQQVDHTKAYYMGSQVLIGDLEFAHGGSGYLVSHEALRRVVEYYAAHKEDLERFTGEQWAGDCVAGDTFKQADAALTRVWPIVQGDHPGEYPWGSWNGDKPLWCYPTMTYHHMSSADIEELWSLEQRWIADGGLDHGDGYLRSRDVFDSYIMPRMTAPQAGWDNGSNDIQKDVTDILSCLHACEDDVECLQYRFDVQTKKCATSALPKLGQKASEGSEYVSGWLYERVEAWRKNRPECGDDLWITSND